MPQSPELTAAFERAARSLFGEQWRHPVADLLSIHVRTAQRIAAAVREGQAYPIAPRAIESLLRALDARGLEITESRAQLEAAIERLKSEP